MPELPEIETVRRVVGPQIAGSTIISVTVNKDKIVGHPSKDCFIRGITGRRVVSVGRRGKGLIINLDDGGSIVIRFGMTGQLIVVPEGFPRENHTHIIFGLADGRQVWYIDPRSFGNAWLIPKDVEDTYSGLGRLGLEPFDPKLTWWFMRDTLGKRNIPVKEALLDQSVVAGIGNIWSDEMLFRARVCPETRCSDMTVPKWKRLTEQIPLVMEFGIEKNSITPEEYLKGKGRKYYDIDYLEAYGHEGMPCPRCGTAFRRSVIGGRSSCWCPKCQRRP